MERDRQGTLRSAIFRTHLQSIAGVIQYIGHEEVWLNHVPHCAQERLVCSWCPICSQVCWHFFYLFVLLSFSFFACILFTNSSPVFGRYTCTQYSLSKGSQNTIQPFLNQLYVLTFERQFLLALIEITIQLPRFVSIKYSFLNYRWSIRNQICIVSLF